MFWLKKILIFICSLILLVVVLSVLGFVALHYVDANKYKNDILRHVNDVSGLNVQVDGPIELRLFPYPYAELNNAKLSVPLESDKIRVGLEQLELRMPLSVLWGNRFEVKSFAAKGVNVEHSINGLLTPLQLRSVQGKFNTTCCSLTADKLNIILADGNKVQAHFKLSLLEEIPRIEGEVRLEHLTLKEHASHRIFSRETFSLPIMGQLVGKVNVAIGTLQLGHFVSRNNQGTLTLEPERIHLTQSGQPFGGQMNTDVTVTHRQSHQYAWNVNINDASAEQWIDGFHGSDKSRGGRLDLRLSGHSSGNSMHQIASRANGNGFFHIRQVTLNSPHFKSTLGGALFSIIGGAAGRNTTPLPCVVGRFKINNGKIQFNDSLGFETDKVVGLLNGHVNLRSEQVKIRVELVPRPNITDLTDMTQAANITGSLKNPQVSVTKGSLARQGGSLLLGVFTGGMSLMAENLFRQVSNQGGVCEGILQQQ